MSEKAGADRIELCDNFFEGGTTPSYATVDYLIKNLSIPLHVMIRPRGGDFLYNSSEFEIMKNEVVEMKKLGAHGIVFGILTSSILVVLRFLFGINNPLSQFIILNESGGDILRLGIGGVNDLSLIHISEPTRPY